MGWALGCKRAPEYTERTNECLLCRDPGSVDSVAHVFGTCCAMQPVWDWTKAALEHVTGWAAPLGEGELLHLVYGADNDTAAGTIVRGVALDTIRAFRAARTTSEHRIADALKLQKVPERRILTPTTAQLTTAMRDRLGTAIVTEWMAAVGQMDGAHGKGDTDARAHHGRPRGMAEFMARWGDVCEMVDGRCVPRPQWLEYGDWQRVTVAAGNSDDGDGDDDGDDGDGEDGGGSD